MTGDLAWLEEYGDRLAAALDDPARRAVMESDDSGAALLLPVGPVGKPKRKRHVYKPGKPDRRRCKVCGRKVTDPIHLHTGARAGFNPGQPRQTSGKFVTHPEPHKAAHYRTIDRHTRAVEHELQLVLKELFAEQAKAALSRLEGNRGRQMLRDHQASGPVDAARIFDLAFWRDKTATAIRRVLAAIGGFVAGHVESQLPAAAEPVTTVHVPAAQDVTEPAVTAVEDLLRSRANQIAGYVTQATYDDIVGQLNDGVTAGESIPQLATRVRTVFEQADRTRAERIARTEVHGAVQGAQLAYAGGLPRTAGVRKEWLATPDARTREAHRHADGQTRPLSEPFLVGGEPLMFPGDPAGTPDEVINCRCSMLMLPPEEKQ